MIQYKSYYIDDDIMIYNNNMEYTGTIYRYNMVLYLYNILCRSKLIIYLLYTIYKMYIIQYNIIASFLLQYHASATYTHYIIIFNIFRTRD